MLQSISQNKGSRYAITDFRGVNNTSNASEKEFSDILNLTHYDYPTLTTREPFGKLAWVSDNGIKLLCAREDGLYYIQESTETSSDGESFTMAWFHRAAYDALSEIPTEANVNPLLLTSSFPWIDTHIERLVNYGAYILIFGYNSNGKIKKWYNTQTNDCGDIDKVLDTNGKSVKFEMCQLDGTVADYTSSSTAPSSPSDGDYWYDTSTSSLMSYSAAKGGWISVVTTYVRVSYADINYDITEDFAENDGIQITGLSVIDSLSEIPEYNMIHTLHEADDEDATNYIVVTGLISGASVTTTKSITIAREMPDMDFCFEHEGRLWGYSNDNHEIYASSQGSFMNYIVYDGESNDSYAATIANDGNFHGGVSFGGYPFFFKTNKIYKIYGSEPSEFTIREISAQGCTAENSIKQISKYLYYKGADGVYSMAVDSYPSKITEELYGVSFGSLGMAHNDEYILIDNSDKSNTYVYNTLKGLWSKIDLTGVEAVTNYEGVSYLARDNYLICLPTSGNLDSEKNIEWYAQSVYIGTSNPDDKYIYKIRIRVTAGVGTKFTLYIKYDDKEWLKEYHHSGQTPLKSFEIPIVPHKCDYFKYKFEGTGHFKLQSVAYSVR